MQTQALLTEIASVFPPIAKPESHEIVYHPNGCGHCDLLRQELEKFAAPTLPTEAIRFLTNEWSCLSSTGMRWVLPSYLRFCVLQETYDALETEFFIYALSPGPEYEAEARTRLRELSTPQVECLLHFLEWCSVHPEWSRYCPEDIARARHFVEVTLKGCAQADASQERTHGGHN